MSAPKSSKPVVSVIGATGAQGGSVVNHLLRDGKFQVRGLTRDVRSAGAKALQEKGVELVQGDVNNKADLEKLFEGAWGAFSVTTWDAAKEDAGAEEKTGRFIADVAVAKKVQFLVFSTLADVKTKSGGRYSVAHFTDKYNVEQYIRTLPIGSAFVSPGIYAQNFIQFPGFKPALAADGVAEFTIPLRHDVGLPIADITDTGVVVSEFFNNPDKWRGQVVRLSPEYITVGQMAAAYQKVTGQPARFKPLPMATFKAYGAPASVVEMLWWFNEFGYFGGESLEETRREFPRLATWEQFLIASKWKL